MDETKVKIRTWQGWPIIVIKENDGIHVANLMIRSDYSCTFSRTWVDNNGNVFGGREHNYSTVEDFLEDLPKYRIALEGFAWNKVVLKNGSTYCK